MKLAKTIPEHFEDTLSTHNCIIYFEDSLSTRNCIIYGKVLQLYFFLLKIFRNKCFLVYSEQGHFKTIFFFKPQCYPITSKFHLALDGSVA